MSNLNTHIRTAHEGLRFICGQVDTFSTEDITDWNVQKVQARRTRQRIEERLKSFFGRDKLKEGATNHWFNMQVFLDALAAHAEPDMDTYSCTMAMDMMEAYYKVRLRVHSHSEAERGLSREFRPACEHGGTCVCLG